MMIEYLKPARMMVHLLQSQNELTTPCQLNAFSIISFSTGFDLSGMFEDTVPMKEMRFMWNKPASSIISKLEEICKKLCLKVRKKEGGLLKLEGSKEVRKGNLGVDADIWDYPTPPHGVTSKVQWWYHEVSEAFYTWYQTSTWRHCLDMARRTTTARATTSWTSSGRAPTFSYRLVSSWTVRAICLRI